MEATSEDIQALAAVIASFAESSQNFWGWDSTLFNTILFANIMAYVTGHVVGRVIALMRKS